MPPIPTWFAGRDAVAGFLATRALHTPGNWRIIATRANGQAAFVIYERQADRYVAHGVNVLTIIGRRIARITLFNDSDLVPYFER